MIRPTLARVRQSHLLHNLQQFRQLDLSQKFLLPVVKANSYGHGDLNIANVFEQNREPRVAVGLIEEAVRIREAGFSGDIYMLGPFEPKAIKAILQFKIIPIINGWRELETVKVHPELRIHLKFDTGMGRLGFRPEEADVVKAATRGLNVQGLCSHLACSEDFEKSSESLSEQQKQKFEIILGIFSHLSSGDHHLFNTDGAVSFHKKYQRLPFGYRPGLGIYGHTTVAGELKGRLRPVLKLESQIAQLNWLAPGHGVSYNSTWKARERSLVAVIPMGYADGYHRSLSNKGQVLIHGQRCPVVGIVCMDYFMVNVTPLADRVAVADSVEIFGDSISVTEVANWAGTIPWEILTSLSERVPKVLE